MHYVIEPPAITSLAVMGCEQRFPVRRVFCIGRNYAEHAREMGVSVDTDRPMFFCKPADAVVSDDGDVPYPPLTDELHHEVEMVLALGAGGSNVNVDAAPSLIYGCGVGLDLTRRDLQRQVKAKAHPWEIAKAFDHSAPVSALCPTSRATPGPETVLSLHVNGELRQQATLAEMVHDVPQIIAALSTLFELKAGDLIFTGTPSGVAALQRGDRFHAELHGLAQLRGRIV